MVKYTSIWEVICEDDKLNVAVLGAGSIGSLIAAKISQFGVDNLLIHARGEHGSAMTINGIEVRGEESFSIKDDSIIVSLDEVGFFSGLENQIDILFITCKANDVASLIEKSQHLLNENSKVICLSNGLGHVERCIEFFGTHRVFAASISHGAWRPEPGVVNWAGKGNISIGKFGEGPGLNDAEEIIELLSNSGLNPKWEDDGRKLVWSKVLLNIAINPVAALIGCENGTLLKSNLFELCSSIMIEGANIARQERVNIQSDEDLNSRLREVIISTSENFCSMLQDVKKGRTTEIEFLNQAIVDRAERYGISTPKNYMLSELIKSLNS
jgi:2-dehydropantoate 2-reductase